MAVNSTYHRIGDAPKRLEDARLVRGAGQYLDDIPLPNDGTLAHAIIVRSEVAHARIRDIVVDEALAQPGVLAILTGHDAELDGLRPTEPHQPTNVQDGTPFAYEPQPLLAVDRVRYVGEPLAVVVAESVNAARDAAEYIEFAFEELALVLDMQTATQAGAPRISEAVPDNRCLEFGFGDSAATDRAFAEAAHCVQLTAHNHRMAHNAMEPRGAIARFDESHQRYRLELSSQNVHVIRDHIAYSLCVDPSEVHVTAPDVGGGFGVRNFIYAEYILALWAARKSGRTVKWVNSRSDGFVSDHQARDFSATAELALDSTGRFTGFRMRCVFNAGAYLIGAGGGVPTGQFCTCPGTVYDIPAVSLDIEAVLTNTVPIGVTRGPGFAEMVDVMERLIDVAGRQTPFDRLTLRRRNMVRAEHMPWTNAVGTTIDSGDFPGCFEQALGKIGIEGFPERQREAAARGYALGLGVANHIKATGGLDEENVEFRLGTEGLVLTTGTQAIGQGHETTFRQIACSMLGVPFEAIHYVAGDTDSIPMGGGHGSSRATYMASTAMHFAAAELIAQARPFAAAMLQAPPEDVEFTNGNFVVAGTNRETSLLSVGAFAAEQGSALRAYHHFKREAMTFPNGCHIAEVEVDLETGMPTLKRYVAVDDYGTLVNPTLVAGQAHGAIAQGVGQGLLEQVVFDDASGQLLSGSFMDYAMPRADDLPSFELEIRGTRCTTNPLGVKGCGEAGAIAGYTAVANAMTDALASQTDRENPGEWHQRISSFAVWDALRSLPRPR